jgi:predicted nucleic-acid-binding Zn-ribbon protein
MTKVAAAICLDCGYTAFYAKDVLKMRAEFQNHPEWFDL